MANIVLKYALNAKGILSIEDNSFNLPPEYPISPIILFPCALTYFAALSTF